MHPEHPKRLAALLGTLTLLSSCSTSPTATRSTIVSPVVSPSASENRAPAATPSSFPDAIYIKTPRQTFNHFFYYALDDEGRIWIKPIRPVKETKGFGPDWALFWSGLPANPKKKDFVKPRSILTLQADADELMAISDEHRHYSIRWIGNPVFPGSPKEWTDVHGWPVEEAYVANDRIKDYRGWGIGRRNQIVKYFEDADGKTFTGGGGLTTYYFLTHDGSEVAFSDSGLPADYSHTMCGPNRGSYVAEGFDVSASTMFMINRYGEMYTRMVDFDTIGSDIMFFKYTYDRANHSKSLISVPAEDWLPHAPIPLTGRARISSQITILTVARHNEGRELRVAGYDSRANPGYYSKLIFKQKLGTPLREEIRDWTFVPVASLAIDPSRLLDPSVRRQAPAPLKAGPVADPADLPIKDVALSGTVQADGQDLPITAELTDFNLECTPAKLRLSADGDHVDLIFHTVEEWYHLKRLDPGRDGTPKNLIGTLEIPSAAYETRNPKLLDALHRVFSVYHLKDFAFWVEATNEYASVKPRYTYKKWPALSMSLTREGRSYPTLAAARHETLRPDGFTAIAESENLRVSAPLKNLGAANSAELSEKITANQATFVALQHAYEDPARVDAQTPFYVTYRGFVGLKIAGTILGGASYWAPYFSTLARNMPTLIARNEAFKQSLLFASKEDLQKAQGIMETRIAAYQKRLDELTSKSAEGPWTYSETASDAWAPLSFGQREASSTDFPACHWIVDDSALSEPHPSIDLKADCGENGQISFRAELTSIQKDIFRASVAAGGPVGTAERPLTTQTTFSLATIDGRPGTMKMASSLLGANADTQTVAAALTVRGDQYAVSLPHLQLNWTK